MKDYTSIRNMGIELARIKCSINPNCFETNDTFYYDETDNVKKFRVKERGFNVAANSHFVLGGITTNLQITIDELKSVWGFQNDPYIMEIKSTNKSIFKGEFVDVLKSGKVCDFLQLIVDKSCFVHFFNLNILYYSLVDIIDSIHDDDMLTYFDDFKTMLYLVVQNDLSSSSSVLYKYNYPNLKDEDCSSFINDIILLIDNYSQHHSVFKTPLLLLKSHLQKGLNQNELVFIQHNTDLEPIERLGDFYMQKIYMLPNAKHVFDNEDDVKSFFMNNSIELNGQKLKNYCFVDSKTNALIQVSDLIVAILGRYFKFCDRLKDCIKHDIDSFTNQQMKSFKMINKILKSSLDHNPVFMHHCTDLLEYQNFVSLVTKYGV